LAWWPGTIAPGRTVIDVVSQLDLFPTCLELARGTLAKDRSYDGVSLVQLLRGTGPSPRTGIYYYHGSELFAIRRGPWKLHLKTINPSAGEEKPKSHDPPLLFNLSRDPSERLNVAAHHPDLIQELLRDIEMHRREVKAGIPQI
jgi:arylsulfatase A-like enzyme